MRMPSREMVERLRAQYPEGTRVELISMDDPYSKLRLGDRGSVTGVDDAGTIFVRWDSGSGLGIVYGVDQVKRIENEMKYETGADFFRDTAASHGMDEALGICGRYLSVQLGTRNQEERQFCRELFAAMTEASAGRTDPAKIVYPYTLAEAKERLEEALYRDSRRRNAECAKMMDTVIPKSCYEPNFYNLNLAAMAALHEYGFQRVSLVLAAHIQSHPRDGRFSRENRLGASGFHVPEGAFDGAVLNAHPVLIDGFARHVRGLYAELHMERFALPGQEEQGHSVQGYTLLRSIWFDNHRGFALAYNPAAPAPFVTWQFTEENGRRDFYWGRYCGSEMAAQDSYRTRVATYMQSEPVKEMTSPILSVELSTEQNCNMLDGLRNNMAQPKPDLTDGQTHEEMRELSPHMLKTEKPSVLEQLREGKKQSSPPRDSEKHPRHRDKDGHER